MESYLVDAIGVEGFIHGLWMRMEEALLVTPLREKDQLSLIDHWNLSSQATDQLYCLVQMLIFSSDQEERFGIALRKKFIEYILTFLMGDVFWIQEIHF